MRDAATRPRLCESFLRGPLGIGRWTPRLGEGPYETKIKRPRRYTFNFTLDPREWGWSSPVDAAPLSLLDMIRESVRRG